MPSTPRRAAIAVAAVLTAVTLVACSSGDGARNAVAVGGTFQFHSPGGQTEIIYAVNVIAICRGFLITLWRAGLVDREDIALRMANGAVFRISLRQDPEGMALLLLPTSVGAADGIAISLPLAPHGRKQCGPLPRVQLFRQCVCRNTGLTQDLGTPSRTPTPHNPGHDVGDATALAGEHVMDEGRVPRTLRPVHERFLPATYHQDTGVDGGAGTEMRGRHPPVLFEVDPRPPLGSHHRGTTDTGAAARDLPLHQEHRVGPPR